MTVKPTTTGWTMVPSPGRVPRTQAMVMRAKPTRQLTDQKDQPLVRERPLTAAEYPFDPREARSSSDTPTPSTTDETTSWAPAAAGGRFTG